MTRVDIRVTPWLEVHPELSDNRNIAERRLKSCVRSLQKRNCLQEYENIFKEWVSEKIIESVAPEELAREKGHFLPHRPVFKENSTTRIRPVFDASAKERNSGSLNDCIEKGPNYLELILSILNRFRQGKME
ncbi:integrase catalytic domain-containing protein [Trichonephila clavata]|uniref:Integrase catalytic domain-containing protein n=1 Tax=Trichonephila clavata TaxID=2740835 RepID=A0A8X6G845_TRICU|nr:integrase catalytic domain-containing protein [Trichonephila clavata]